MAFKKHLGVGGSPRNPTLCDVEEEDVKDEEPEEQPELEPEYGFAQFAQPTQNNNMNGWLVEYDDEEEEVDEMEDDEMDVDNDEDDAEVVHPYEEVDPLNRPPPDTDKENVFARATAPVTSFTLQPLPPICMNMGAVHSKVKTLDKQMYDRYTTESKMLKRIDQGERRINEFDYDLAVMESELREQILNHSKMVQLVEGLSKQFQECRKEEDMRAENRELREMLRSTQERVDYYRETSEFYRNRSARVSWDCDQLSRWEFRVKEHLPHEMRYQEVPYDPAADPALRIRPDDPYVTARDAATTSARDDGDDAAALRDPQPSELCGSPRDSQIMPPKKMTQAAIDKLVADKVAEAIAQDRATRGNTGGTSGNIGGNGDQGGAPPVRKCSYTGFVKCNPTTFCGNEGAVTTLGLEVANGKSWAEMKTMMKEEFCPPEEIQRMEIEL
ncbi:hypothetical protein Tco_0381820 [Tanacetum coccineum]